MLNAIKTSISFSVILLSSPIIFIYSVFAFSPLTLFAFAIRNLAFIFILIKKSVTLINAIISPMSNSVNAYFSLYSLSLSPLLFLTTLFDSIYLIHSIISLHSLSIFANSLLNPLNIYANLSLSTSLNTVLISSLNDIGIGIPAFKNCITLLASSLPSTSSILLPMRSFANTSYNSLLSLQYCSTLSFITISIISASSSSLSVSL